MQEQQFSQQFFFLLLLFFLPPPSPFSGCGAQRDYKIQDFKLPSALQSTHKRGEGWQECPSHESGGCSQFQAGRAHAVIPISPFLLSHPGGSRLLHSSHPMAAQCQDGALPVQAVKPCALRSFNTRTRKVGNFGETEVKTSSCGRQNYFSSLLPPNLNPAQNLSCRNNFQLLQFSL